MVGAGVGDRHLPAGAARLRGAYVGGRNLWEEAARAYFWWIGQGSPGRDRFGLTVGPAAETVWLDAPVNSIGP